MRYGFSLQLLAVIIILCFFMPLYAQVNVVDSFESTNLNKIWDTRMIVPGAYTLQSEVVRSGHGALKITLKEGDKFEAGNTTSLPSERAELLEATQLVSKEGSLNEYAFSMFLPDTFPIVSTRLVIAQWKQYCPKGVCWDDSPPLAIRYSSGMLRITSQTDSGEITLYKTTEEIKNT